MPLQPHCIIVHPLASPCTPLHGAWSALVWFGLTWCAIVCHGLPWSAMVCLGLPRSAMVCHGLSWPALVCPGLPWFWRLEPISGTRCMDGMDGMGWKSLNPSLLRAPLCGANNKQKRPAQVGLCKMLWHFVAFWLSERHFDKLQLHTNSAISWL